MPLILPGNVATATAAVGYDVENSIRLDASGYMHKTQSGGNRQIFTMSCWTKLTGGYGASGGSLLSTDGTDDDSNFHFTVKADKLTLHIYGADAFTTTPVLRDYASWYHIVLAVDTTQSTSSNRMKLYVNNVQQTLAEAGDYPDQNDNFGVNESGTVIGVGTHPAASSVAGYALNSYLAEYCLIDGQQLTPSSFGEANSDSPTIWQPIDPSDLTFGTNGFYLDFKDSANLGNDANGGTDLTEVSIAAADQAIDTPTNNFNTFNPLIFRTGRTATTITQGNCKAIFSDGGGNTTAWGTILLNHGKWYFEMKVLIANYSHIGTWQTMGAWTNPGVYDAISGLNSYRQDGVSHDENIGTATYGDAWSADDIIGCAFDCDTGTIWFSVGGVWQDSATQAEVVAGTTTNAAFTGKAYSTNGVLAAASGYSGASLEANFGGCSAFAISSGNADDNGYGSFEYDVPTGYYAICTKNLAEFGG